MDTNPVRRKGVHSRAWSTLITLSKRHPGMSGIVDELGPYEAGWSRWRRRVDRTDRSSWTGTSVFNFLTLHSIRIVGERERSRKCEEENSKMNEWSGDHVECCVCVCAVSHFNRQLLYDLSRVFFPPKASGVIQSSVHPACIGQCFATGTGLSCGLHIGRREDSKPYTRRAVPEGGFKFYRTGLHVPVSPCTLKLSFQRNLDTHRKTP
jgi:hypothetical protein